jgi:threonine/homoserine/homoserine lactone efflux protein
VIWTFVPVAVLLSLTPGPATARRPQRRGRRPAGAPVLPYALALAATLVVVDFAWYLSLAAAVSRAKRAAAGGRFVRPVEQVTGAVLLALAGRLALESR